MAGKYVAEFEFLDRHYKIEKIKLVFDSFEEMREFLGEFKFRKKRCYFVRETSLRENLKEG